MIDVSVILPCRNEEQTIGKCIRQIENVFKKHKIRGEIIVSDSSTDYSPYIAEEHKVKLVRHNKKGYGIAILEGIKKSSGGYIIIGDSDGTYDFTEIPKFIKKLNQGNDLVLGSRLKGKIVKGAMPLHHKYLGNPILSAILNLFFRTKVSDAHSGFRAITKKAFKKLELKTTGMEFASEMIIKAAKNNLKIAEVPIIYYPRLGESKLKSFSDGWRHLRFMLLFSPTYLFFIPGSILFFIGLTFLTMLLFGKFIANGQNISEYVSITSSLLAILGYQLINLGLYSRIYATHSGFEKYDTFINFIAEKITLEKGLLIGLMIIIFGITTIFIKFPRENMLFSLTLGIIGLQTFFSVFFISMMAVEKKETE